MGAAYYVLHRRLGADLTAVNRFMVLLLLWLVVSAGFTSWQGHVGGLLAGGAVAAAFAYAPGTGAGRRCRRGRARRCWRCWRWRR